MMKNKSKKVLVVGVAIFWTVLAAYNFFTVINAADPHLGDIYAQLAGIDLFLALIFLTIGFG